MNELVMQQLENMVANNKAAISKMQTKTNVIKVIGIGGAGINILQGMMKNEISGITFIAADTDFKFLAKSITPIKIELGAKATMGLGTGSNSENGRKAAQESFKEIIGAIEGSDMIVLVAGMGGGTGTGASQIIADAARTLGIFTVGLVTRPFSREGKVRLEKADIGISKLKNSLTSMFTISNDQITNSSTKIDLLNLFQACDLIFCDFVRGITDLLNNRISFPSDPVHKEIKQDDMHRSENLLGLMQQIDDTNLTIEEKLKLAKTLSALSREKSNLANEKAEFAREKVKQLNGTISDYQYLPPATFPTQSDTSVICPKCNARNAYHASGKGFGLGKAAVGGLLLGPVGLLGGLIGSKKLVVQCISCGNKWSP